MKLFIKLRNKYFTTFAALVLLLLASFGLFNANTIQTIDASMIKFDNEKTITITNGSFSSFSSSSQYPYTPSNYTVSGNSTPEMKTGAININKADFEKNYKKYGLSEYDRPEKIGEDNYVLMINADKTSNYAYTSSEFTLPANGHYYVTVSAMTIGDSATASVFLTQDDKVYNNCVIDKISSGEWTNYTFFVSTNPYESVTLKFGMQIGSRVNNNGASGCVLFDELHAGQISKDRLNECLATFPEGSFKSVELRSPNAYKAYNFDNEIVDYSTSSAGVVTNANYFAVSDSGANQKNFDIRNNSITITTEDSYLLYKGQEEELMSNSTYRFSIMVKASKIDSGSAFVKVDEILDESEDFEDFMESTPADKTPKSSNLTISNKTSNTITDGYQEYVVYVRTGSEKSSKVQFSFGLGSETANATGDVTFKSFLIERVPYSAFSSASSDGQVGKIDISERLTLPSSEYANYSFDKMQSESFDGVPYPATPVDWTKSAKGEGVQLSGVVNLQSFDAVMNKYSDKINTIATPAVLDKLSNNVLMIYNGAMSAQSYTSSVKTLTANKAYKITTFVNTHMWDSDSNGVTVIAKTGSNVLAVAEDIKTAGKWQRVTFEITVPSNSIDLTIELALGNGNKLSSGYAFFDKILVEEAETVNDFRNNFDEYEVANNGKVELDLTNPMLTSTTTRDFNIPTLYTGENKGGTNVNAGIVDLVENDLKSVIAADKMDALRDLEGDNRKVLAISTVLNQDAKYTYTSVLKYNFESSKYYKFTFDLFTDGITQEDKEKKYDNDILAEGVNIELTGLENSKFSYVKSEGEWTTYEIYIGLSSSATSNLVFSMGSEFTGCYGKAFLGNITVTEVEQSDFDSVATNSTILKVDTVIQAEEDSTTTQDTQSNGFSWVYIPTIATFLAIIVAVVGIFVRKNMKFKKHVGKKKVEYDRDITVLQNKYRRLASDQRDKDIRELTKECNELIELRTEYEEKYKEALSRLRSTRLANRDGSKQHEINAIEREVKHISKEVARFGVQVNNYENEIEFMQTEAYLIDLEKRMMREDNSMRSQIRKEAEMSEEKRAEAVAKREAKQELAEQKAKAKTDKLERKQQKLQAEREMIKQQLEEAKELDQKALKERQLKQIKLEEEKLAKEKAKADRELKKLEQQKLAQEKLEAEKQAQEAEKQVEDAETEVESVESVESVNSDAEQSAEDAETNESEVVAEDADTSAKVVETTEAEQNSEAETAKDEPKAEVENAADEPVEQKSNSANEEQNN